MNQTGMEIDVKEQELNNNNNQSENAAFALSDKVNHESSSFFDTFGGSAAKIDSDESLLPSPKAMLETIMPCEKLCNSFRQIADDLSDGDVLKTIIKHEISEPKITSDREDKERDQFPLNLKSIRRNVSKKLCREFKKLQKSFVHLSHGIFYIDSLPHEHKLLFRRSLIQNYVFVHGNHYRPHEMGKRWHFDAIYDAI